MKFETYDIKVTTVTASQEYLFHRTVSIHIEKTTVIVLGFYDVLGFNVAYDFFNCIFTVWLIISDLVSFYCSPWQVLDPLHGSCQSIFSTHYWIKIILVR